MKYYAINMKDESVRIMTLLMGDVETEIEKWHDADGVLGYTEISLDVVPEDRVFRNAWRFCDEKGITIDVDAAKECKKNQMRALRQPLLEALDVEVMRAIEQDDSALKADLVSKKQELRDVTKLELPDDLVELKRVPTGDSQMIEWTSLIPLGTFFLAWLGFIEKRLHGMKEDVQQQLKEKEKIDKIVYGIFKDDIEKIEKSVEKLSDKIDRLLDRE